MMQNTRDECSPVRNRCTHVIRSFAPMQFHGWAVFGGTSVSSPIIAAVYNLKGNASSLDYAHSLYKAKASHFWDITSGSDCNCGGTYLCTAGPGYDGPTGLGTPNGDGAF